MACRRCEITTFENSNGVNLFFVIEAWLRAQGDDAKTGELAPSGLDMKQLPIQLRSRGDEIATIYKSIFGSNITFNTKIYFIHTSLEVVQASTTCSTTLHCFCLYRPPPN